MRIPSCGVGAVVLSILSFASVLPAMADNQEVKPVVAPAPKEEPEYGKKAGDIMIRLRGLMIMPRDHADIDPIGGNTHISNAYVPEVDISYFITDYIALELIAATSKHDVSAHGTAAGNVDLGSVWLLPPTLTLQYHPLPKSRISPYIGGGINYTIFYNVDNPNHGPVQDVDYKNSLGYAVQAGVDIRVVDNWYFNADVKHLWLNNKVSINNGAIKAKVDVDPWIFGVGLGYKF